MQADKHTNVFIVDDSDSIRQRLIAMLATLSHVTIVGEARTAAEAIAGISSLRPHIVVLDLNLGASSGMEVLRTVNRNLPDVSVVVLTNHAEPQYRQACLKAGALHFLDKSTQLDQVRNLLSEFEAPKGRE